MVRTIFVDATHVPSYPSFSLCIKDSPGVDHARLILLVKPVDKLIPFV